MIPKSDTWTIDVHLQRAQRDWLEWEREAGRRVGGQALQHGYRYLSWLNSEHFAVLQTLLLRFLDEPNVVLVHIGHTEDALQQSQQRIY